MDVEILEQRQKLCKMCHSKTKGCFGSPQPSILIFSVILTINTKWGAEFLHPMKDKESE
jgi:hypothetical protein